MSKVNLFILVVILLTIGAVWLLFFGSTSDEQPPKIIYEEGAMGQVNHPEDMSDDEWKKELSSEEYHVLRESGTERPFTGDLLHEKRSGSYRCAGCGFSLFSSEAKYDSGSGWPSFYEAVHDKHVKLRTDASTLPVQTEVLCARCGSHLGHVYPDGPEPTGQRYCINSVALKFNPDSDTENHV